jgi:HK97 family phage portal protein
MSIFSRLSSFFSPKASGTIDSSLVRRGDAVWQAFTGVPGGVLSETSALSVSAVYGCVNLIAGAISALPIHIYRRDQNGDLTREYNNPLWWLLNEEFAPRWPAAMGWSFSAGSKLLHGDSFIEIRRSPNGTIRALVPIHQDRVEVIATPDGERLIYEIKPDMTIRSPDPETRRTRVIDQDDMLHIPGFGYNGLRGLSPLRHALRMTGGVAVNAQEFSSKFLENAARPEMALKTDASLTDEQFARLKEWIAEHTGPQNAGRPMILEGGLDVKTLTMPMEEMQLLETRRFQVEEIARVYGVPAFMIGHTDKTTSWGAGVGAMGTGFVRFTLRDHLNAFENEINRKFFRTAGRVAKFDTSELENADLKTLIETFRIALGRAGEQPIMSVEEVRHKLNLSRKVDGNLTTPSTAPAPIDPEEDAEE